MKKKSSKTGKGNTGQKYNDPFEPAKKPLPEYRERLIKLITEKELTDREVFGVTVSQRALQKLSPSEIRDLLVVFQALDFAGRGYVGPVEVRKAMRALGFKLSSTEARQMVQHASLSGRDIIDFNEFLDLVIEKQGDDRDVFEEIMAGFKLMDYDKSGKLTADNLLQAFEEANLKITKKEIEDMMQEADTNGDGFVDSEEFVKIMLQTNLF